MRIYLVRQASGDEGEAADGTTETMPDGTIRVDITEGLSKDLFAQTLAHELVHCCERVLGFEIPERAVHLLGVGLHEAKINFKRR